MSNIAIWVEHMAGNLIELIIFAAIAFFIINKLLSTLGSTSENDPTKKSSGKSFFGESEKIKDVSDTSIDNSATILRPKFSFKPSLKQRLNLKDLIVAENELEIRSGIEDVLNKLPSFNPANFLNGAKKAFQLIINAGESQDEAEINALIDKRYIESFNAMASGYGKYQNNATLTAHIAEIYLFGNNIFIKILFAGKNITDKVQELHEEWTFTKSVLTPGPEWHLSNIDRPQ